jgi:rod shape-determining protein MreD
MRWINFFIIVLLLLVAQISFGRLLGLGPQRISPNLFLLLAMVLAFRVGNGSSLLACWVLGLAKDLSGGSLLGSYACGFALVGFLVIWLREWFYVEHPLIIILVVALGTVLVEQCAFLIELFKGASSTIHYRDFCVEMLFVALFSAALAPYGQWAVAKLARVLGVEFGKSYG